MTIADVVDDASCIWVEYNNTPYRAELIGHDATTNIAIVRLSSPLQTSPSFTWANPWKSPSPPSSFLA